MVYMCSSVMTLTFKITIKIKMDAYIVSEHQRYLRFSYKQLMIVLFGSHKCEAMGERIFWPQDDIRFCYNDFMMYCPGHGKCGAKDEQICWPQD